MKARPADWMLGRPTSSLHTQLLAGDDADGRVLEFDVDVRLVGHWQIIQRASLQLEDSLRVICGDGTKSWIIKLHTDAIIDFDVDDVGGRIIVRDHVLHVVVDDCDVHSMQKPNGYSGCDHLHGLVKWQCLQVVVLFGQERRCRSTFGQVQVRAQLREQLAAR